MSLYLKCHRLHSVRNVLFSFYYSIVFENGYRNPFKSNLDNKMCSMHDAYTTDTSIICFTKYLLVIVYIYIKTLFQGRQ